MCVPVYMNKYRAMPYLELISIVMKCSLSISFILIVIWVLENKSKAKRKSSDENHNRQIISFLHYWGRGNLSKLLNFGQKNYDFI